MRKDVYEMIMKTTGAGLDNIPKYKSQEELSFAMVTLLSTIIGIVSGAAASEKDMRNDIISRSN